MKTKYIMRTWKIKNETTKEIKYVKANNCDHAVNIAKATFPDDLCTITVISDLINDPDDNLEKNIETFNSRMSARFDYE